MCPARKKTYRRAIELSSMNSRRWRQHNKHDKADDDVDGGSILADEVSKNVCRGVGSKGG